MLSKIYKDKIIAKENIMDLKLDKSKIIIIIENFEGFFDYDKSVIEYTIKTTRYNMLANLILAIDRKFDSITEVYILSKGQSEPDIFAAQFERLPIFRIQLAYSTLEEYEKDVQTTMIYKIVSIIAPQNIIILGDKSELDLEIRSSLPIINTIKIVDLDISINNKDIKSIINGIDVSLPFVEDYYLFPQYVSNKKWVLKKTKIPEYESKKPLSRVNLIKTLDMPEDAFVIIMVNPNLNIYVKDEFLEMCYNIAEKNEKIYFILVTEKMINITKYKNQFKIITKIDQATTILPACDLFISPAIPWGFTIATFAIMAAVPTLCLAVAQNNEEAIKRSPSLEKVLYEELICKTIDEIANKIDELVLNKVYYNEVVEKMKFVQWGVYDTKWVKLLDRVLEKQGFEWQIITLKEKVYLNFIIDQTRTTVNELLNFYSVAPSDIFIADVEKYLDGFPDLQMIIYSLRFVHEKNGKYLQKMTELLLEPNFTIMNTYYLRYQIGVYGFCNAIFDAADYKVSYFVYKNLFERFMATIDTSKYEPILQKTGVVVVTCMQLLNMNTHAPTKQTLDYCYNLQKHFNKKVILIVTGEPSYAEAGNIYTTNFINYLILEKKKYYIEIEDEKIIAYHPLVDQYSEQTLRDVVDYIYSWRPELVFNVGNNSLISDACKIFTKSASYQCGNGFGVTCSGITIVPREPRPEEDAPIKEFLEEQGQKAIYSPMTAKLPVSDRVFTREEYEISEDAFVMCIIGGRLNTEITKEYTKVIKEILAMDDKILIIFVGGFNDYEKWILEDELLQKQTKYIGFLQEGVTEFCKICNLYLNPFRQGGGISAVEAMYQGVPVVAVEKGDAAVMAGPDFAITKATYIETVRKYLTDKEFMDKQKERAKARAERTFDTKGAIGKLLKDLEALY